jgi:hypothetical protein
LINKPNQQCDNKDGFKMNLGYLEIHGYDLQTKISHTIIQKKTYVLFIANYSCHHLNGTNCEQYKHMKQQTANICIAKDTITNLMYQVTVNNLLFSGKIVSHKGSIYNTKHQKPH